MQKDCYAALESLFVCFCFFVRVAAQVHSFNCIKVSEVDAIEEVCSYTGTLVISWIFKTCLPFGYT